MLSSLFRFWLKITYRDQPDDNEPVIRYGNPSHADFNDLEWHSPRKETNTPSLYYNNSKQRRPSRTDPIIFFDNKRKLKCNITKFLEDRKKTTLNDIKEHLCSFIEVAKLRNEAKKRLDIQAIIENCIETLNQEEKIYFDEHHKSWYIQTSRPKSISDKEARYLKGKEGLGDGWKNIRDEDEAIQWIYSHFNPDEFEYFCCALLEHSKVKNPQVSRKNEKTGADGGIDGHGELQITNDRKEKIIFQAKRYLPSSQVPVNQIRDFLGAYDFEDITHGLFITTGVFSEKAIEECTLLNEKEHNPKTIELIDKNRMIEIMLSKGKNPKGFGLYKTKEYGRLFINEDILKNSVQQ